MAGLSMVTLLPDELVLSKLFPFLSLREFAQLDSAVTNEKCRNILLKRFGTYVAQGDPVIPLSKSLSYWLFLRGMKLSTISVAPDGFEYLNLRQLQQITCEAINLDLSSSDIHDDEIAALIPYCRKIQSIRLRDHYSHHLRTNQRYTERILTALSQHCVALTHLQLGFQRLFSDESLLNVLIGCPNLQELKFINNEIFTGDAFCDYSCTGKYNNEGNKEGTTSANNDGDDEYEYEDEYHNDDAPDDSNAVGRVKVQPFNAVVSEGVLSVNTQPKGTHHSVPVVTNTHTNTSGGNDIFSTSGGTTSSGNFQDHLARHSNNSSDTTTTTTTTTTNTTANTTTSNNGTTTTCSRSGGTASCLSLTTLWINSCASFSSDGAIALASLSPRLQYVHLRGCTGLTGVAIMALADLCPCIETINISACTGIDNGAIVYFVQHSANLVKLVMNNLPRLDDSTIRGIAESMHKHLKYVECYCCYAVTRFASAPLLNRGCVVRSSTMVATNV